jgi:nucleoside-diphosphate-sugar epimerase
VTRKISTAGKHPPTVLVTGGCGFIGTWVLRELLGRGLRVVVLDAGERPARWERVIGTASAEVPLVRGSLLDRGLLGHVFEEHQISNVIHLAALLTPACQADPWEGCRVNVLGSVALFEQVRLQGAGLKGFSYASSVAVFGDEPDRAGAAGGVDHDPLTFYGAFKKSVELIAAQYWRHFKVASVGIRPQVAYGPERDAGLTAGPSLAARAAARGEAFCLIYTGSVGYDYVEDVARAFVRGALETPRGAPVVDLPGEVTDVDGVLAAIEAAAPGAAQRISASGPPIPTHTPSNPRLISALYPDWKVTSLAEGMRRTVDFYRPAKAAGD